MGITNKLAAIVLTVVFSCLFLCIFPQKFLSITKNRLGATITTEIENHTTVRYRVKGSFFGKRAMISDMRDSTLYFNNGDAVTLSQLGGIGARSTAHFPKTLQQLFFITAFGLIPLSVVNNLITGQPVEVTQGLMYVSAGAMTAGLVTVWLRNKRIHTGKGKVLRILVRDFEDFGAPVSPAKQPH